MHAVEDLVGSVVSSHNPKTLGWFINGKKMMSSKSAVWPRNQYCGSAFFNVDPDPAIYLDANTVPYPGNQTNADGQSLKSQKVRRL